MAQLFSRGTLTRNRWDYYESSNSWASVFGSVASGPIGAYFQNAVSASLQLDIYNLTWFASANTTWQIALFSPPQVYVPVTPTEIEIHACQPDLPTPAGYCVMFSTISSGFATIQRVSNSVSGGILAPVAGEPFITLPPLWAIGIFAPAVATGVEVSLNVWFQAVLDNIPPAT